ncbi:MAG: hypothetical protein IAG13_17070 [Deltaproteobacteria bacterium]|nr:hypothetical protein [Nannocystaceae bacterium]
MLLVARWASFVGAAELAEANAVLAIHGVAVAIALASVRWWYPGGAPKSLWKRSSIVPVLVALALAAASAAVFTATLRDTTEPWMMPTSEVVLWLTDSAWWWIGLAFLAVALEQAFYFGLLFDGIAAISGERNAAIGSALLFGLTVLDPLLVVLGVFAAALRVWSGSVVPAVVLRVAATVGWLAWFAMP